MAWTGMNLKQPFRRLLVAVALLLGLPASWLICCFSHSDRQSIHRFSTRAKYLETSNDDASSAALIAVSNFALIDVINNQTLIASLLNDDDDSSIFVLDLDQLVSVSADKKNDYDAANNYSNKLKLTIRVDAQGPVHYMVLDWDVGDVVRTGLRPPFALAGLDDDPNQYTQEAAPTRFGHARALTIPGMHSLQATPFDVLGRAGRSRTLRLRVVGSNNDALLLKMPPSSLQRSTTTSIQQSFSEVQHFFIRPPTEQERQRSQHGDETNNSHNEELPHQMHRTHHNHHPAGSRNNKIIIFHQIIHPQNASATPLNAM